MDHQIIKNFSVGGSEDQRITLSFQLVDEQGINQSAALAAQLAYDPLWVKIPGFQYAPEEWHGIGEPKIRPLMMRVVGGGEDAYLEVQFNEGYSRAGLDEPASLRLLTGILRGHDMISESTGRQFAGEIDAALRRYASRVHFQG